MTSSFIIKRAGHNIPLDVLQHLCSQQDVFFGISGLSAKEPGTVTAIRFSNKVDPKDLLAKLERFKPDNLALVLNSLPGDGMQPYPLLTNQDNKPILVAVMDGNFSQYAQQGSAFPDAYLCMQRELIPRIKKLYGYVNGDLDKIVAELKDDMWTNDITNLMLGDRGSITLIAGNGEIITNVVNGDETAEDFEWGYCSNKMGFGATAEEPVVVPEETLDDLEADMKELVQGGQSATPPVEAKPAAAAPATSGKRHIPGAKPVHPVASVEPLARAVASGDGKPQSVPAAPQPASSPGTGPTVNPVPPGVDPATPGNTPAETQWATINVPTSMTPKARAKWLKNRCTGKIIPQGMGKSNKLTQLWKDATPDFKATWCEQNGIKGMEVAQFTPAAAKANGNGQVVEPKPVQQAQAQAPAQASHRRHIPGVAPKPAATDKTAQPAVSPKPAEKPSEGPSVVTEPLPIISPAQKQAVLAHLETPEVKQLIDNHSKIIRDPKAFADLEKKIPDYAEQLGLSSIEDVFNWPFEVIRELDFKAKDNSVVLCFWLKLTCIKQAQMLEQLTAPPKEQQEPQQQPQPEPQKATGTSGPAPSVRRRIPNFNRVAM